MGLPRPGLAAPVEGNGQAKLEGAIPLLTAPALVAVGSLPSQLRRSGAGLAALIAGQREKSQPRLRHVSQPPLVAVRRVVSRHMGLPRPGLAAPVEGNGQTEPEGAVTLLAAPTLVAAGNLLSQVCRSGAGLAASVAVGGRLGHAGSPCAGLAALIAGDKQAKQAAGAVGPVPTAGAELVPDQLPHRQQQRQHNAHSAHNDAEGMVLEGLGVHSEQTAGEEHQSIQLEKEHRHSPFQYRMTYMVYYRTKPSKRKE